MRAILTFFAFLFICGCNDAPPVPGAQVAVTVPVPVSAPPVVVAAPAAPSPVLEPDLLRQLPLVPDEFVKFKYMDQTDTLRYMRAYVLGGPFDATTMVTMMNIMPHAAPDGVSIAFTRNRCPVITEQGLYLRQGADDVFYGVDEKNTRFALPK